MQCLSVRLSSRVASTTTHATARRRNSSRAVSSRPASSSSSSPSQPPPKPEEILRVGKKTDFNGLKAAKRIALKEQKYSEETIETAFDEIVDSSMRFFKEKVEANPKDSQAIFMLANVYQTLEMLQKAKECYLECLKLDKTNLDANNNLALILQEKGDIDAAEAYYLQALTHHPDSVDVLFNWASLKLNERKDLGGAKTLIDRIVELEPNLKKHPLVKELAGDDIDDEPDEPFVPPI